MGKQKKSPEQVARKLARKPPQSEGELANKLAGLDRGRVTEALLAEVEGGRIGEDVAEGVREALRWIDPDPEASRARLERVWRDEQAPEDARVVASEALGYEQARREGEAEVVGGTARMGPPVELGRVAFFFRFDRPDGTSSLAQCVLGGPHEVLHAFYAARGSPDLFDPFVEEQREREAEEPIEVPTGEAAALAVSVADAEETFSLAQMDPQGDVAAHERAVRNALRRAGGEADPPPPPEPKKPTDEELASLLERIRQLGWELEREAILDAIETAGGSIEPDEASLRAVAGHLPDDERAHLVWMTRMLARWLAWRGDEAEARTAAGLAERTEADFTASPLVHALLQGLLDDLGHHVAEQHGVPDEHAELSSLRGPVGRGPLNEPDFAELDAELDRLLDAFHELGGPGIDRQLDWAESALISLIDAHEALPTRTRPDDVERWLLETIPGELYYRPDQTEELLGALRRFRDHVLVEQEGVDTQATGWDLLDREGLAPELARLGDDPTTWTELKRDLKEGEAAGYDVSTADGAAAWRRTRFHDEVVEGGQERMQRARERARELRKTKKKGKGRKRKR